MSIPALVNNQFTPEFAAYTSIVLGSISGYHGTTPEPGVISFSFDQFIKTLESDKVVDPSYARELPGYAKEISDINARQHGNFEFERTKLSVIEKAYKLGLVDRNDLLNPALLARA